MKRTLRICIIVAVAFFGFRYRTQIMHAVDSVTGKKDNYAVLDKTFDSIEKRKQKMQNVEE